MNAWLLKLPIFLVGGILRRLGHYRVWRLFRELRHRDPEWIEGALRYILREEGDNAVLDPYFLEAWSRRILRHPHAILDLSVPESVGRQLDEIPSETTSRERRLLWRFFSSIWNGRGDVIEVGPFLGGTSRAIALGMMAHARKPDGRLVTFDRFQHYYPPAKLNEILGKLCEKGVLSAGCIRQIGEQSSFLEIFKALHEDHEYGRRIVPLAFPLPELPEEAKEAALWFTLDSVKECSAFFVDGCKSWYGTKFFMTECAKVAQVGSFFIFQDFLQFTCFWLPSFMGLFKETFRLVAYVDQTYVFELMAPLSSERIERTFPDRPEDVDAGTFQQLFDHAIAAASDRSDREAEIKHALQYGGALAYIGLVEEARKWLTDLRDSHRACGYEKLVEIALKTPTYRPNGAAGEPVRL